MLLPYHPRPRNSQLDGSVSEGLASYLQNIRLGQNPDNACPFPHQHPVVPLQESKNKVDGGVIVDNGERRVHNVPHSTAQECIQRLTLGGSIEDCLLGYAAHASAAFENR